MVERWAREIASFQKLVGTCNHKTRLIGIARHGHGLLLMARYGGEECLGGHSLE